MSSPLDFARADVGLSSSGGRFRGPPVAAYALAGEAPLAWCGRALRTWFTRAGFTLPGRPYDLGSIRMLKEALDEAGMFLPPSAEPMPGDIILLEGTAGNADGMLIGGHHGALVESVTPTLVQSIDGDWGTPDRVQRVTRRRAASDIWGYGRIPGASTGAAGSLVTRGVLLAGAFFGGRAALRWWKGRRSS